MPDKDDRLQVYVNNNVSIDSNSRKLLEINRASNFTPRVATTGWYQYTTSFVLPETGYYNIIFRSISSAGFNIYIDNFYLEKIPYPNTRCEWIGNVSNNWSDPANWLNEILPATGKDVIIGDGYTYLPTLMTNTVCRSLTTARNADLFIRDATLTVEEDAYLNGDIRLLDAAPKLLVYGKLTFDHYSRLFSEGSSPEITVYGDLTIDISFVTDFTMAEGLLKLTGSNSSTMFMDCEVTLQNFTIQKFGATVNLVNPGQRKILIEGDLTVAGGGSLITPTGNYTFECKNALHAYGNFMMAGGTLEFSGVTHDVVLSENSYLNHVLLSENVYVFVPTNIRVNGNLNIGNRHLNIYNNTLYLKGNFISSQSSSFLQDGSTVIFNGTGDQTCSSASFTNLVLNKSAGKLIIPSGSNIYTASYDYTAGSIEVNGGYFTAYDLTDINIKGSYILTSGSITLTQDGAQNVDLDADLTISGGTFTINGGGAYGSDWAYSRNIAINLSGGTLAFNNASGVNLTDTGHTLTFDGSGGTIKCKGSFLINRANFTMPGAGTGCTVEMTGTADTYVLTVSTSSFRNLKINKTARSDSDRDSTDRSDGRDGEFRTNMVSLSGNLNVTGDLTITAGYLDLAGFTCNVGNDYHQYSYLYMYGSALLNVNNDVILHTGAAGNLSAGNIIVKRNWTTQSGVTLQMSSLVTVSFGGTVNSTLTLASPDMWFGSMVIDKTTGHVFVAEGTQYLNIANDLTVNTGESLFLRNSTVSVTDMFTASGNTYLEAGCSVLTYDLNLAGNMQLVNASVTVTRNFVEQATGILNIIPGTFIINTPYIGTYYNFSGITYFDGGTFQITNDGMQFTPTSQFDFRSGNLILGGSFRAIDSNVFRPTAGTVEFTGARNCTVECSNGNYFHNLILNKPSTSWSLNFGTDITVNNDLTVQSGNNVLGPHTLNVGRDMIINGNWLIASQTASIINVGRNWTNNVGINAFAQGTGTVNFVSAQQGVINRDDFYNVNFNKTSPEVNDMVIASAGTVKVDGNLNIINGTVKLSSGGILDANGMVDINGGLDISSDGAISTLRLAGNFFDESDETPFFIANQGCTIIFDGSGDQTFGGDYPTGTNLNLYNVTVSKTGGSVLPNNPIDVSGNFQISSGGWGYVDAGYTKTFRGNLIIESAGTFNDNTGIVALAGTADSNLKLLGTAIFGTFTINKSAASNVNLTGNAIFSGTSVINLTAGILNVNTYTFKYAGTMNIYTDGRLNLTAGSVLNINSSGTLNLQGGGEFYSIGSENNPALVTAETGYYTFSTSAAQVTTLGASYTTFERMGTNGINLTSRCGLDPDHRFYRCTFQNGIAGGTLLTINTNASHTIVGANFPANTWSGASNVTRTNSGAMYMITFSSWTGAFGGEDFDNDNYNKITWLQPEPPATPLNLQIAIVNDEVVLTWNAVANATGYNVYRSFTPDNPSSFELMISTDLTSYSDESLLYYPRAFYYVTAFAE